LYHTANPLSTKFEELSARGKYPLAPDMDLTLTLPKFIIGVNCQLSDKGFRK